MGKLTKNQKLAAEKIEAGKAYSLKGAASLVKEINCYGQGFRAQHTS